MSELCVIFDLDGTLVDSETLCNQVYLDLLPELAEPVEALTMRYRGWQLAVIMADLAARLGRPLPADFEAQYRARVSAAFDTDLRAMPGVAAMLARLPYPRCIASSGPPAKIRQALACTGLSAHFGDSLFSAYDVGAWKPDPGLFLHAAQAMGFAPDRCVVVEDSEVGLAAAAAAGMHALHYVPYGAVETGPHRFSDMAVLPARIADWQYSLPS